MFETNSILQKLPKHLLDLIIDQPYNEYTPLDHSIWRYVMRQNVHYLKEVAHKSYLTGLKRTGITINEIPQMYGMNRILKEIGWAAVAVDGFIPPSAFMEFQAYNVLVIAADIRPIDQIQYTPAPDIIHEAAGHAPIISNLEYAEYLKQFGYYGSKAFSSVKDQNLYKAVRHLSILKADPYSSKEEIKAAENFIMEVESTIGARSELAKIRNLHWWTVEYGLIGNIYNPQIYGAGLLSSIGESFHAMEDKVLKLPYSIDAMNYNFDITTMQPLLFVTPNFEYLTNVLNEFVSSMAIKTGGIEGVKKAIDSRSIACCCLDSGVQISGQVDSFIAHNNEIIYLKTTGPSSISYQNTQLESHPKEYHVNGYGTPVGELKSPRSEFINWNDYMLKNAGLTLNSTCFFEWTSGIILKGKLRNILRKEGKIIILSFEDCTVKYKDQVLFRPEWGIFDLSIGKKITSVFNGPADPDAYGHTFEVPSEKTHKLVHTQKSRSLHKLYEQASKLRLANTSQTKDIEIIYNLLSQKFPGDWLLAIELLELAEKYPDLKIKNKILDYLQRKKDKEPTLLKLINDGIALSKITYD